MNKYTLVALLLILCVGCSNNESSKELPEINGDWYGAIETPNAPLPIEITFDHDEELTGTITIPPQNIQGFSLSNMSFQDEELSFDMEIPGQVIRSNPVKLLLNLLKVNFISKVQLFRFI